ncbi:MAG: hypothetical protein KF816_11425 [Melioribacteraceae bacterium]|nr:hypothetical protein [Melioribacteraceae bacterium]
MADKKEVMVEIIGAVFDAKGQITGTVAMEINEALRLVELNAARFVDAPAGAEIKDETVEEEPDSSWKKEEICLFLEEKKITYDEKATKDALLKTYEEWKVLGKS